MVSIFYQYTYTENDVYDKIILTMFMLQGKESHF